MTEKSYPRIKEIIVERKGVYGKQLIYPICEDAKRFAAIAGNKTLSIEIIKLIKELGYVVKTNPETL